MSASAGKATSRRDRTRLIGRLRPLRPGPTGPQSPSWWEMPRSSAASRTETPCSLSCRTAAIVRGSNPPVVQRCGAQQLLAEVVPRVDRHRREAGSALHAEVGADLPHFDAILGAVDQPGEREDVAVGRLLVVEEDLLPSALAASASRGLLPKCTPGRARPLQHPGGGTVEDPSSNDWHKRHRTAPSSMRQMPRVPHAPRGCQFSRRLAASSDQPVIAGWLYCFQSTPRPFPAAGERVCSRRPEGGRLHWRRPCRTMRGGPELRRPTQTIARTCPPRMATSGLADCAAPALRPPWIGSASRSMRKADPIAWSPRRL